MDNLSIDDRAFDSSTANSLTDQEFEQLQLIRRLQEALAAELGRVEFNKILLEEKYSEIKAKVLEAQQQQQTFVQGLNTKYGGISINIEDGTFEKTS
jgi:hypothetical protein